jgi:ABC-type phosphate transport system permease subunit
MDFKSPQWQSAFRYASEGQRFELGFTRIVAALLIPVVASFYSARLALLLAIPCGMAVCWYAARAIRRFTKRDSN